MQKLFSLKRFIGELCFFSSDFQDHLSKLQKKLIRIESLYVESRLQIPIPVHQVFHIFRKEYHDQEDDQKFHSFTMQVTNR